MKLIRYFQDELCVPVFTLLLDLHNNFVHGPYETESFWELYQSLAPKLKCSFCLLNCNYIRLWYDITLEPFREFDKENVSVSKFSNIYNWGELPTPSLFNPLNLTNHIGSTKDHILSYYLRHKKYTLQYK